MTILISGVDNTPRPAFVEVEEYVPLSFRTYESTLGGVRDVRLGGLSSSFLELTLGIEINVLRGFTLLSFEAIHEPNISDRTIEREGLPILALDNLIFTGRIGTQYCDLPTLFSVGFGSDFIELMFDSQLSAAQQSIVCGNVRFFVGNNSLLGIRIYDLRQEQIAAVKSMATVTSGTGSSIL